MLSSPPLQQSVCSDKERGVVVGPFLHTSPPFWHALAALCYRCFVCLFLEKIHLIWKDSSDFRVYGKHSLKAHSGILSTGLFGWFYNNKFTTQKKCNDNANNNNRHSLTVCCVQLICLHSMLIFLYNCVVAYFYDLKKNNNPSLTNITTT